MRTVFVIGAGASAAIGIPTGSELKEKIAKLLDIHFDYHKQSLVTTRSQQLCVKSPE